MGKRKMINALSILLLSHSLVFVKNIGGQGDPTVYEQVKNDLDKRMSDPILLYREYEAREFTLNNNSLTSYEFLSSGVVNPFYDIFENRYMKMTTESSQLASPLWGNPLFFCINIPRMTYESYETFVDPGGVTRHRNPTPRRKINKFNKEGVGWTTSQRRSKSRYNNAYSLFWIMEPTSFRWDRRFLTRQAAAKLLGKDTKDLGFDLRDHTFTPTDGFRKDPTRDNFPHNENDAYNELVDPLKSFNWQKAYEMERLNAINEGLYFHVTAGNVPAPKSQYVIDRLAVTARGLTFNHQFINTGPSSAFHTIFAGKIDRYFTDRAFGVDRPHRVWEGGVGEFVHDFPKCQGVGDHKFVERQFVPCGSTGKNQWYYGNNFIYVKTNYDDYPDTPDVYGGGVVYNGDAEEIHLNYKLDQSFCNMLLAVDFVVNGVVIKGSKFNDVVKKDPPAWTLDTRDDAWAVERSSSTRIEFTQDTYVNPPDPIIVSCQDPKKPWRKFAQPIIKPGALPPITFYGNADPIPREAALLDCFVTLQKFNPTAGGTSQSVESFHGAIQGILPAESFTPTALPHRGLTLSHWYLYVTPIPSIICIQDSVSKECRTAADFNHLIRDEVKEWDWRLADTSDITLKPGKVFDIPYEKTQLAYLDSTHKGVWISYFDWVATDQQSLSHIYLNRYLNDSVLRFGEDRAWPTSRQQSSDADSLMLDPFFTGSYFQHLYFNPVPFLGRATADKSHQMVYLGVGLARDVPRAAQDIHMPYSGEPGQSPPACDLYVSRNYLRIQDPDDDEAYFKPIGFPNDPADTCIALTSRLTTDHALQYIRKVYVKPMSQNVTGGPPTWYKKYLESDSQEFCNRVKTLNNLLPQRMCPTMFPKPYTTPSGGLLTTAKSSVLRERPDGLEFKYQENRGLTIDSHFSLYIWDSRVIHGIFMTVLTIFVIPISTFLVRFYKETWMDSRLYINHVWYFLHIMSTIFITILLFVGLHRQRYSSHLIGWSYTLSSRVHRKMGYFAVMICFSMLVSGGIRAMNKKFRAFTIMLHWLAGVVAYLCFLGCMLTSIFIQGSPASYFDYSIYVFKFSTWIKEPILWILTGWTIIELVMLIRMFALLSKSDKIMKLTCPRLYYPCPIPVIPEHSVFDAPLRGIRIPMFQIYVLVSILFTALIAGCLIRFTPFTNPLRGFGYMTCTHEKSGTVRDMFPKYCPKLKGQLI